MEEHNEVLGESCIDGGKCHHNGYCTGEGKCFRRECCSPFTGYEGPWKYEEEPEPVVGTGIYVEGKVVAWFADFTEEAREWCTENHFGQWLAWRSTQPTYIPMTLEEIAEAERLGAELAAKLRVE